MELPFGMVINNDIVHGEVKLITRQVIFLFDLFKRKTCLDVLSITRDQVLIKHIYIFMMSFSGKRNKFTHLKNTCIVRFIGREASSERLCQLSPRESTQPLNETINLYLQGVFEKNFPCLAKLK